MVHAWKMLRPDIPLQRYLEEGMDIKDILLQNHKGNFYRHLRFFLSLSSIAEAIDCALHMDAFEKNIRKKLIQQTSYPILLFIFSFATLYVFSGYVIPQLMQSFDMEHEHPFLVQGVQALRILIYVLGGAVCICLLLMLLWKKYPSYALFHLPYICKLTSLPSQICSYTLSGYLHVLMHRGISTKDAFVFLNQLPSNTLIHRCVRALQQGLMEGEDILTLLQKQPLIHSSFVQCWRIGMHAQNMEKALSDAMQRQEEMWLRLIKRLSITIQAVAYSFVALMVLLVYQIMLVPLQLLETM